MLDKKFLIQNKDLYIENMKKRNKTPDYETFEKLYFNHKKYLEELEKKRAKHNKISQNSNEAKTLKEEIIELSKKEKILNDNLKTWLYNQPNILLPEVPIGADENENMIIYESSKTLTQTTFPHYDLIDNLIMKESATQLSGSRFLVFKNELSNFKRALVSFLLEHNQSCGYESYDVPYIVNTETLYGTGQLPKFAEDAFELTNGQWLISTGEVSLVNLFAKQCFSEEELPKLCTTYSPCFRREAGSASRDTKGLIRLHQFHKVELVSICKPEDAETYHAKQLETAKQALEKLEIPYRVIMICSGDTGFTATKQYDIEVWMPGSNRFLEIASCSQCGSFQAIRANIKYKINGKNCYVHTLNGSSLPIERLIAAIIENHYDEKTNSVNIPNALKNYFKKNFISLFS